MIKNLLLVGLGGGIGSMLRYASSLLISSKIFPFATLFVNIIGSFIIGAILAISIKDEIFLTNWKLFIATGICGGFTTFSAFSLENMLLLQYGYYGIAAFFICSSILLVVIAAFLGYLLLIKNR